MDKQEAIREQIEEALQKPEIPALYFNGFSNVLGAGDVLIVLTRNGAPLAVLNASYTVAKTFAMKLQDIIANLENATGNTIMTVDEVEQKITVKQEP